MTDRIEPVGRRRDPQPVERVHFSPVEREQQRREREQRRRRRQADTPQAPAGGDGDAASPRLDLRA